MYYSLSSRRHGNARARIPAIKSGGSFGHSYGWDDLDLGHGFHQTRQGERFTISEAARRKVLDRLLDLNHERHAAEVAAGLFDQKKPKSRRSRKGKEEDAPANGSLF